MTCGSSHGQMVVVADSAYAQVLKELPSCLFDRLLMSSPDDVRDVNNSDHGLKFLVVNTPVRLTRLMQTLQQLSSSTLDSSPVQTLGSGSAEPMELLRLLVTLGSEQQPSVTDAQSSVTEGNSNYILVADDDPMLRKSWCSFCTSSITAASRLLPTA